MYHFICHKDFFRIKKPVNPNFCINPFGILYKPNEYLNAAPTPINTYLKMA